MVRLLVTVLVGTAEGPEVTPAVALYKRDLTTPIEAAGTGLAPTVQVRVTVDARGVVSDVASYVRARAGMGYRRREDGRGSIQEWLRASYPQYDRRLLEFFGTHPTATDENDPIPAA